MDSVDAASSAAEVAGGRVGIGSTRGKDPRQVVMADVARRAGVSHQTVSRVLNDPRSVKAETRDADLVVRASTAPPR
jgi:hypothetical protein